MEMRILPVNLCLYNYYRRLDQQNYRTDDYALGGALAGLVSGKRSGAEKTLKRGSSGVMICGGATTGLLGAEIPARFWQARH